MSAYRRKWLRRLRRDESSPSPDLSSSPSLDDERSLRDYPPELMEMIHAARAEMERYGESAPDWDEDAIEAAYTQAMELMDRVPEAAATLLAKVQAAEQRRRDPSSDSESESESEPEPDVRVILPSGQVEDEERDDPGAYDPMHLYAMLADRYHFSDSEMQQMHFPRLFAYFREAVRMSEESEARIKARQEEEERKRKRKRTRGGRIDGRDVEVTEAEAELARLAVRPRPYDGPVVPLITRTG